jgi:hypothetical protein
MARGRKTGGRKRGTPNRRTIAQQEIAASGLLPLEFLCSVYRDAKQSMTRRIEAARCAAPYIHPRISTTEAPPPKPDEVISRIRISFVAPDGTLVPFRPPPELKNNQIFNSPSEAAR